MKFNAQLCKIRIWPRDHFKHKVLNFNRRPNERLAMYRPYSAGSVLRLSSSLVTSYFEHMNIPVTSVTQNRSEPKVVLPEYHNTLFEVNGHGTAMTTVIVTTENLGRQKFFLSQSQPHVFTNANCITSWSGMPDTEKWCDIYKHILGRWHKYGSRYNWGCNRLMSQEHCFSILTLLQSPTHLLPTLYCKLRFKIFCKFLLILLSIDSKYF